MHGVNRGGMMTYLTMKEIDWIDKVIEPAN